MLQLDELWLHSHHFIMFDSDNWTITKWKCISVNVACSYRCCSMTAFCNFPQNNICYWGLHTWAAGDTAGEEFQETVGGGRQWPWCTLKTEGRFIYYNSMHNDQKRMTNRCIQFLIQHGFMIIPVYTFREDVEWGIRSSQKTCSHKLFLLYIKEMQPMTHFSLRLIEPHL